MLWNQFIETDETELVKLREYTAVELEVYVVTMYYVYIYIPIFKNLGLLVVSQIIYIHLIYVDHYDPSSAKKEKKLDDISNDTCMWLPSPTKGYTLSIVSIKAVVKCLKLSFELQIFFERIEPTIFWT